MTSNSPEYAKAWREANKERVQAYRAANADRRRGNYRAWSAANRDRKNELHRKWSAENPEKVKAKNDIWRAANLDAAKAAQKQYRDENPARMNALSAKKRAIKRQATPPWLTEYHHRQILAIYETCGACQHVDHIAPLNGKTSCGLHVPWNLQVLAAEENIRKGNKELNCGPAFPAAFNVRTLETESCG